MSYHEVKRNILSNTVSNYVRTAVGMAAGLVTFRLLYQTLDREQFGFWSLLWSVFGYGILLDFGFGFAAQKRVAELSVKQDWDRLSRVLSTILFSYIGMAAVVVIVAIAGSHRIISWFGISAANTEEFRRVLVLFFAGIGLAFPLGIFPEILRGQQRIRLANHLVTGATALRLVFMVLALWLHWSFFTIMLIALLSTLVPDLLAAILALRRTPAVRLHPRLVSPGILGDTMKFSIFAYLAAASNIVLAKTDQLVIGAALSVAAVAVYQAGARVAETFSQFTRQMQDTLSPAAAHLHATGDRTALRDLLLNGTRWSVLIATPLYLLCAFYLDELLQVLTGDPMIPAETRLVGQVLLAWFYTTILTHSVSKRIFMMTGHERRLMRLGMGEAVANLGLSLILVTVFRSVVGVAVGSLIPTLVFGWLILWPWVARETGVSGWALFRQAILPFWRACVPMLGLLLLLAAVPALRPQGHWLTLITHGPVAALAGAAGTWFWALDERERAGFRRRFGALLPGNRKPAGQVRTSVA